MLSVKSVNALSHYTDWTIAHVHSGALGWNGFMAFGMLYWLAPRLFQTELWSKRLCNLHFWLGTLGILFYIVAIYAAGVTQGLMWRAFDSTGRLMYPDFIETVVRILPMYWVRALGGSMYVTGVGLCLLNLVMTWRSRPAEYRVPVIEAAPLSEPPGELEPQVVIPRHPTMVHLGYQLQFFAQAAWHRVWERKPLRFTVWVTAAVVLASAFEMVPTFLIRSNLPTIRSVQPYTPLEVLGRDEYVAEGCYNCHSQLIRPIRAETERYGEYSKPGEFIYDHPFQWGSRRIGPDLQRIGGKYPALWHVRHMEDPASVTPGSIMPRYGWMLNEPTDFASLEQRIDALLMLGVPYGDVLGRAEPMARDQARKIAQEIVEQGGPAGLEDKQIVALIAYLQRLGTDLMKAPPETHPAAPLLAEPGQGANSNLVLGSSGHHPASENSHEAQ
jgi:cytochrome c oxidase cbb3-type subunit I/II